MERRSRGIEHRINLIVAERATRSAASGNGKKAGRDLGSLRRHRRSRQQAMRRAAAAAALVTVAMFGGQTSPVHAAKQSAKPDTSKSETSPLTIRARPLSGFSRADGSRVRFGALEWRGGVVLTSDDARFGGWSGLAIDKDGKRLLAVSDAGTWLAADLTYSAGRLAGIENARLGPLKARDGGRLKRDRDRDAEAMVIVDGSLSRGRVMIAFEQNHRIGAFDVTAGAIGAPASYLAIPSEARRMRSLKGFEALTMLRGGRWRGGLLALAERLPDTKGRHSGWIMARGKNHRLAIEDIGGFDLTDAIGLPSGDVVILERRFRWLEGVKMRLRRFKVADIAPGAVLSGEVLLEADMTFEIDNMEALSAHRDANGDTILTILSDDNFNGFLQRTLLLQFALPGERREARGD